MGSHAGTWERGKKQHLKNVSRKNKGCREFNEKKKPLSDNRSNNQDNNDPFAFLFPGPCMDARVCLCFFTAGSVTPENCRG